ncbi:MAG: hypothetical protein M0008_02980, partial [Actinomycetota bacterium]|nr:hypothetical protein [Actinomycetota bacterium]
PSRSEVGGQCPPGLRPHRGVRAIDALALVVEVRASFVPAVDLGVGGVEVDRRALPGELDPSSFGNQSGTCLAGG